MRLRIPLTAAVMAIALVLTSCGGGGGGGSNALSSTGRAVQNVQRLSILSMGKGGIAIAPFMLTGPGGGSGGTTGSTTGSGGGFGGGGTCSIGFFFRGFGGPAGHAATLMKSRAGRDEGSTTGSGGGGGEPGSDFYYDEWLQLWVSVEWSNTSYTTSFFLDEARTQPAGHVASTFTGDWESFPQTYHNEYEFTAGLLAGSHGVYDCTQNSLFEGSMSYEDTYADGSHDNGESSWSSELSAWHSRWDGANNEGWFEDTGIWSSDGTGTYTCSNSEGWASTWHYNADWSGSAHFEGPQDRQGDLRNQGIDSRAPEPSRRSRRSVKY